MCSPSQSPEQVESPATRPDSSRLWLMSWLARRPDLMARLAVVYQRIRSTSASRRRLLRCAGISMAGAALLLAIGSAWWPAHTARAASIFVNGGVAIANDGSCSLTEAILNANNDYQVFSAFGECQPGSGADTITLSGSTFTLQSALGGTFLGGDVGLPPISSEVTIDGGGATITRDANAPDFRILAVASSGNLTLNGTTLNNGSVAVDGGGIALANGAQATLANSVISGNEAVGYGGGIWQTGSDSKLLLLETTVSGNKSGKAGGGIAVYRGQSTTILNSTLSGNEATRSGGAISTSYSTQVRVESSTIRNNTAGRSGGGVDQAFGSQTLVNSTITDNTAAVNGGGINTFGITLIQESTITANSAVMKGGGIIGTHHFGGVTFIRSIISGNSAADGAEIYRQFQSVPSDGVFLADAYNVFGHSGLTHDDAFDNFTSGAADFDATFDKEKVALGNILHTLDQNGGPTLTHALVPNSPAVDFAPSALCAGAIDQRGLGRPADGNSTPSSSECDAGSFELNAAVPTPTSTPSETPLPSATPLPTAEPSHTPTTTPTAGPSPTTSSSPTPGPSPTPSATATPGPSPTGSPPAVPSVSPTTTATRPPNLDWSQYLPVAVRPAP